MLERRIAGVLLLECKDGLDRLMPCPYMLGYPVAWLDHGGFPFRIAPGEVVDYASATIMWPARGVLGAPFDPKADLSVVSLVPPGWRGRGPRLDVCFGDPQRG